MNRTAFALIFLFTFLITLLVAQRALLYEGFGATSPGTIVQLQTSHVPTMEDLVAIQHEKKRAMQESDNMTSGRW